MKNVPGEIAHWLRRATISELEQIRAEEMERAPLLRAMLLIEAIDEELLKRRSIVADWFV